MRRVSGDWSHFVDAVVTVFDMSVHVFLVMDVNGQIKECRNAAADNHPWSTIQLVNFISHFPSNCRKNKSYFSLYPRWHWWFGLKVHSWSRLLFDSDSKETFFLHCNQVLGWTCSCSEARFYQRQRLRLQIQGWRFCFPNHNNCRFLVELWRTHSLVCRRSCSFVRKCSWDKLRYHFYRMRWLSWWSWWSKWPGLKLYWHLSHSWSQDCCFVLLGWQWKGQRIGQGKEGAKCS